ncbi:MAG TPA: serine hydrolase [Roseiflexaceae bacterium]|nr:serine hydrolase [Roseiflexaceae bacterium]HMP42001.1 serine hydrolase [Roseiflexaceae bacterium]
MAIFRSLLLLGILTLVLAACANAPAAPAPPAYWPTAGWRSAAPAAHGIDSTRLAALDAAAAALPYLDGLVIVRNGYIVYEYYANDHRADTLHDVASVTKSWTSALVGIARAQGKLPDLDTTLPDLLPTYFAAGAYPDKRAITLRHLLMMRSGIEYDEMKLDSGEYGGPELLEQDTTQVALSFPMAFTPGEAWNYSTLDTQLISAVMQQATGTPLHTFAKEHLFAPLGISNYQWLTDGAGTTIGGQNLSLTPRDMAKLGLLYLHGGKWEGRQLVPADWVRESTMPQGEAYYVPTGQVERIAFYGYHWWLWEDSWYDGMSNGVHAMGYAGQSVLILPRLNMIIVTTAELPSPDQEEPQRAGIHTLIVEQILPAIIP